MKAGFTLVKGVAKRKTRAELEEEIARLQPYAEAAICLQRIAMQRMIDPFPTKLDGYTLISSGDPEPGDAYRSIGIVGLGRASGGVVIAMQGEPCGAQWLTDVINRWSKSVDPYEREVASKAQRALCEAIEANAAIRERQARFEKSGFVLTIDGVRYARTNGYRSLLKELVDYGSAYVPGGRVIHADDPRHPDKETP